MKARLIVFSILAIWLGSSPSAQPGSLEPALTLSDVLARVIENHPQFQVNQWQYRAAQARIREAEQSKPAEIGLDIENFAGSGSVRGFDGTETTLSLGRVIELGDKPQWRGTVAEREADLLRRQHDIERIDLLANSARLFITVATLQEQEALLQEAVTLATSTVEQTRRRVIAGRMAEVELSRAQIDLSRTRIRLAKITNQLGTTRRLLASQWGDDTATYRLLTPGLFVLQAPESFDALLQRLNQNPALTLYASQQRLRDAQLQLAMAGRKPDIEWRAGIRHLSSTDDAALVMSFNIPLGSEKRAQPAMASANAVRAQTEFELQRRTLEMQGTLFQALQNMQTAHEQYQILANKIIPQATAALHQYENGYRIGRYSFLELKDAQKTLLEVRLDAIDAAQQYHLSRIEIERLTAAKMNVGENE